MHVTTGVVLDVLRQVDFLLTREKVDDWQVFSQVTQKHAPLLLLSSHIMLQGFS